MILPITGKELHKRILEHGGTLERQGAKHLVYVGPHGRFTVPGGKGRHKHNITGAVVASAARCLGTTSKKLIR